MRPITDILRDIRKGKAVDEATRKLSQVVAAVIATGKAGSVSITLTVKPQKNDEGQVVIITQVKAKTPDEDLPDAIFFVDHEEEGFDLLRTDPTQRELFNDASATGRAAVVS